MRMRAALTGVFSVTAAASVPLFPAIVLCLSRAPASAPRLVAALLRALLVKVRG